MSITGRDNGGRLTAQTMKVGNPIARTLMPAMMQLIKDNPATRAA